MPQSLEAGRMSVSEMKPLRWVHGVAVSLLLLPWAPCEGSVPTVTAVLHGTAVLPCSVPFISGTEDLLVSWAKKIGKNQSLVLHAFNKGQFDLTHQAPQYKDRTNMTPDLSNGRLDLTLTHVEHPDEGVYVCHVTHPANYRDIEVGLTVIGSVPTVTAVLHGTAVLPCSVSFISGTEDLMVSWVKKNDTKPSLVIHVFNKGQFDLTHQAPQYRGRTNMSPDLPNGRLDLTLTHVEHPDEGVYVCQVTNPADYRDIEVRLTVIERGTSGGYRGLFWIWLPCTLSGLLGCYLFYRCYSYYRRRSSSAEEVKSVDIEAVELELLSRSSPKPETKVASVCTPASPKKLHCHQCPFMLPNR